MRCPHCEKTTPEKGYCCERAELDTLRTVTDEVIRHLDQEVDVTSIGALDVAEAVEHARNRLVAVRRPNLRARVA